MKVLAVGPDPIPVNEYIKRGTVVHPKTAVNLAALSLFCPELFSSKPESTEEERWEAFKKEQAKKIKKG